MQIMLNLTIVRMIILLAPQRYVRLNHTVDYWHLTGSCPEIPDESPEMRPHCGVRWWCVHVLREHDGRLSGCL